MLWNLSLVYFNTQEALFRLSGGQHTIYLQEAPGIVRFGCQVARPQHIKSELALLMRQMKDLITEQNQDPLVAACFFHQRFVRINPFLDGSDVIAHLILEEQTLKRTVREVLVEPHNHEQYKCAMQAGSANNNIAPLVKFVLTQIGFSDHCRVVPGYLAPFRLSPLSDRDRAAAKDDA